jgi:hypothetical protein
MLIAVEDGDKIWYSSYQVFLEFPHPFESHESIFSDLPCKTYDTDVTETCYAGKISHTMPVPLDLTWADQAKAPTATE